MPDQNATVLEFAAILGEAIARAHLAGKSEFFPKKKRAPAIKENRSTATDLMNKEEDREDAHNITTQTLP